MAWYNFKQNLQTGVNWTTYHLFRNADLNHFTIYMHMYHQDMSVKLLGVNLMMQDDSQKGSELYLCCHVLNITWVTPVQWVLPWGAGNE